MRHAETVWNRQKRIQGQSDSPLTAAGKRQAIRWGQQLKDFAWDRLLASDTGRAVQTAENINAALKIPLTTDARLREQDWGQWIGKTVAQIKRVHPGLLVELERAGWNFCPPGGETRIALLERSRAALTDAAAQWPSTRILVVTHEGVMKSLIYYLCDRQFLPCEPAIIESGRLHWLMQTQAGLRLEKINALALG
jgi:probable phosphoglycerate mutase